MSRTAPRPKKEIKMIRLHVFAAVTALCCIATFWTSTVVTELFLSRASVAALKIALPWGFLLLVPAMATAGITGSRLAKGRNGGLIGTKLKRMKIIAANGALILIPSAFALSWMASHAAFALPFYLVQAAELVAGAANLILMALNFRDGRKLTSGRRRRAAARP